MIRLFVYSKIEMEPCGQELGEVGFFFSIPKIKNSSAPRNMINPITFQTPHNITAMTEDSNGIFWVGTLYGLYELKRRGDHSFVYSLHVPDNTTGCISGALIQAIREDKNKNLWVATGDNGLNLKNKDSSKFILFRTDKGLISNTIRSLLTDRHGNIWMGGNMGLSKLEVATNTVINLCCGRWIEIE